VKFEPIIPTAGRDFHPVGGRRPGANRNSRNSLLWEGLWEAGNWAGRL